jgi:hypothetical protein
MQGNKGRFLYVVVSGGVTYIKGVVMVTRGRIQNGVRKNMCQREAVQYENIWEHDRITRHPFKGTK